MRKKDEGPLSLRAKILASAAGLLAAWAVVTISTAAYHGSSPSDFAAANFASMSLTAAVAAGEQRLSNGDAADADAFSRQALGMSPISSAALRIFGLSEQALNHNDAAVAAFSQASALGWRDGPTQLWLTQALLTSGNRRGAAERLDAALRLAPYSDVLHGIVDQLVLSNAMTPQIASRMALRPFWRGVYFADYQNASLPAREQLIRQLAATGAHPSRDEIFALTTALANAGETAEARTLWFGLQNQKPDKLYDPEFRHVGVTPTPPFEWSLLSLVGSTIQPGDDQNSHSLVATTDGSAAGALARQMTTLAPGVHSLAVRGHASAATDGMLTWVVQCGPQPRILFDQKDISGTPGTFVVPASCPFQNVELRVKASPRTDSVTVTYDQISLR